MPPEYSDPTLASIQPCYATPSAGMHPSHTLPIKLRAIASAGFKLVEVAFPDLEAYAESQHHKYAKINNRGEGDVEALCETAKEVAAMCADLGLTVLALHPFSQFEGYTDTAQREEGFNRARTWFKVLKALNCQMLQVGSNNDPASSGDRDVIARDLRQLADEAAALDPPVRIAYEMWAWGAHVNTWEDTWDVCARVDRPNFGLCLDTFQIAARAYADPLSPTGLLRIPSGTPFQTLASSLTALARTLPPEKIFYLQISDAALPRFSPSSTSPSEPTPESVLLREAENLSQDQPIPVHPLYAWSNAYRPLPYQHAPNTPNHGAYLTHAVLQICRAVLQTGYRGPWSYEVFYKAGMEGEDEGIPGWWAREAWAVHGRLMRDVEADIRVGDVDKRE